MNIEVILTTDDPKLGKRGEIVKVASGFARNYLIPYQKAVWATPDKLKQIATEKAREEAREKKRLETARSTANKINQTRLLVTMPAGEGGKLFGAVTNHEIVAELGRVGIAVDKRDVHLEEPIKMLGDYKIPFKFPGNITANLRLSVVKKA